jgi:ribonuclease R
LKNSLIPQIEALITAPGYQPLNKSEMARALRLTPEQRGAFRQALGELVAKGRLVEGKKAKYRRNVPREGQSDNAAPPFRGSQRRAGTKAARGAGGVIGKISFAPDRQKKSAFLIPEEPEKIPELRGMDRPRVLIPARYTANALDGDRVEIRLLRGAAPKWQRQRSQGKSAPGRGGADDSLHGQVLHILERGRTTVVGKFHGKGARATVVPDDGRLPGSFRLVSVLPEAKIGDVIVAEFIEWENPESIPTAAMIEVLGKDDDPGVDILSVVHRFGLPVHFPENVLREAEEISETVPPAELARREDWRDRDVFTIDPEDAKDFDDAICVTKDPDGTWELAVHIADVSYYVTGRTALDREAQKRGNSVYLADRVIPMLPEKLSNGVCSLKPHVERLTHAAMIRFDASGKVLATRFASAVIRSQRRYSYEEAYAILKLPAREIEGWSDPHERHIAECVQRSWELAAMLRQRRFNNGALDLDFPEVRVVIDEKGRAVGVKRSEYDESHQLIEEFMLAANEAVATVTKNAPVPSLYRVHEDPDPGRLEEFADLARTFGHQVGDVSNRAELQKLLKNVRGCLEEHSIKIALLKSLKRAVYLAEPLGHYGLSKTNYTHFTSPIRRYADLVVHRVLRQWLCKQGEPSTARQVDRPPTQAEMIGMAEHISKTERIAAEAEMETQRLKMIEDLERLCAEDGDTTFFANINEVRPIGVFLELNELLVKGMIRREDLPPRDEYMFDRARNQFVSRGGATVLGVGGKIKVRLHRVDRDRGFIDFVPA